LFFFDSMLIHILHFATNNKYIDRPYDSGIDNCDKPMVYGITALWIVTVTSLYIMAIYVLSYAATAVFGVIYGPLLLILVMCIPGLIMIMAASDTIFARGTRLIIGVALMYIGAGILGTVNIHALAPFLLLIKLISIGGIIYYLWDSEIVVGIIKRIYVESGFLEKYDNGEHMQADDVLFMVFNQLTDTEEEQTDELSRKIL